MQAFFCALLLLPTVYGFRKAGDGTVVADGILDMNHFPIMGLSAPKEPSEAASKAYVDASSPSCVVLSPATTTVECPPVSRGEGVTCIIRGRTMEDGKAGVAGEEAFFDVNLDGFQGVVGFDAEKGWFNVTFPSEATMIGDILTLEVKFWGASIKNSPYSVLVNAVDPTLTTVECDMESICNANVIQCRIKTYNSVGVLSSIGAIPVTSTILGYELKYAPPFEDVITANPVIGSEGDFIVEFPAWIMGENIKVTVFMNGIVGGSTTFDRVPSIPSSSNVWYNLATMPNAVNGACWHSGHVRVGAFVYMFGGYEPRVGIVRRYNLLCDTWKELSVTVPSFTEGIRAVLARDFTIHMMGRRASDETCPDIINVFNIKTETFDTSYGFPLDSRTHGFGGVATSWNAGFYAAGYTCSNYIPKNTGDNNFWFFDPKDKSWTTMDTPFPISDYGNAVALTNDGILHAIGGVDTNQYFVYDPLTRKWEEGIPYPQLGKIVYGSAFSVRTSDGSELPCGVGGRDGNSAAILDVVCNHHGAWNVTLTSVPHSFYDCQVEVYPTPDGGTVVMILGGKSIAGNDCRAVPIAMHIPAL